MTTTPQQSDEELRLEIVKFVYEEPTAGELKVYGSNEVAVQAFMDSPMVKKFAKFIKARDTTIAREALDGLLPQMTAEDYGLWVREEIITRLEALNKGDS